MMSEIVDLGDVAGIVADVVSPLAEQNGISFAWQVDADVPLVRADFEKLRHVLENLCGNAMKFTPEGGSVRLHIARSDDGSSVLMSVSDTGIGIDPADQQRIFERFVQVDSSVSRKYSGTGLGLSLAKEYAEMHGGRIEVDSALGRGSTFTVHLPVEEGGA